MKIAFVGKGGSGKTTLSGAVHPPPRRQRAVRSSPSTPTSTSTWAPALGLTEEQAAALPALGAHLPQIKEYLRGDNPRIASADAMVKTTPPGRGSRLLRLVERQPGLRRLRATVALDDGRVRLMVTGAVHRGGPRRGLLPLQGRRGRAVPEPPGRRPGRVRGGRHDRRRRLLRLRPVHPLRPDLPGRRADPQGRRRLPPVQGVRPGLRRRARGGRQQGHGPGRPGLPARARSATTCSSCSGQSDWVRRLEKGATRRQLRPWRRPTATVLAPCSGSGPSRRTAAGWRSADTGRRSTSISATRRAGETRRRAPTWRPRSTRTFVLGHPQLMRPASEPWRRTSEPRPNTAEHHRRTGRRPRDRGRRTFAFLRYFRWVALPPRRGETRAFALSLELSRCAKISLLSVYRVLMVPGVDEPTPPCLHPTTIPRHTVATHDSRSDPQAPPGPDCVRSPGKTGHHDLRHLRRPSPPTPPTTPRRAAAGGWPGTCRPPWWSS